MTYKEIQVPSEKIKEVYGAVLKDLNELIPTSNVKERINKEATESFDKSELDKYTALQNRVFAITPNCIDIMHKDSMTRLVLSPRKPWSLTYDLYFNCGSEQDNPVKLYIKEVQSMLKAAELSDRLVLTEKQVEGFDWYKQGNAQLQCKYWLEKTLEFKSQYSEEDIQKIEKAEHIFNQKVKTKHGDIKAVKPIEKEEQTKGGFWLCFAVTTAAIAVVMFIISF